MNEIVIDLEAIEKAVKTYMQEERAKREERARQEETARYERVYKLLSLLLEHYRKYPTRSRAKEFIDYIMERHRLAYQEGITDDFYKVRHNILVCRFILPTPMTEKEICKKLRIRKLVYKKNIRKGIEELMVPAFGVEGMKWG